MAQFIGEPIGKRFIGEPIGKRFIGEPIGNRFMGFVWGDTVVRTQKLAGWLNGKSNHYSITKRQI